MSQLDGARNILELFMIADSAGQEHHRSRISPLHRSCWPCLLLVATLLLAPFSTLGQLYTGSVTGLVTDSSGATIPDVKITLVDQGKGYSFTATTDSTGRYLLRSIPPGTYTVTAEAANFQKETQEGIKVDVSQNISVDLALKLGSVNDTVEVKASDVQLQTEDAVTGQVVNRKFVNDLPLVDRNFTNLAYLAPGVTETNAPGTKNAQGGINFNSNGSRNATSDVLIDGASASNFDQNSGLNNVLYTPSVDSVEEFKVQQANFTAEYGFSAGALINVVTRSGTNKLHGSVYEFFRNSVMDANNWFNNKNGQPIAALKRNDFGGSIGGPIRKDKTFFFFDYEGLRERNATNAVAGVPTAAERTGDFGVLCGANGGTFDATGLCSAPAGQLWDPYSGSFNSNPEPANPNGIGPGALRTTFIPFNNLSTYQSAGNPNLVGTPFALPARPGNLIDPVAAKLIQLFPLPTNQATDLSSLQNSNWFGSGVNPSSNNQFDIKIDQRFNERDLLSAKYSQQNASSNSFDCFNNIADPCTGGPVVARRHIFSLTHTHTFSNTLIFTATYGFQRGFDNQQGVSGNASGAQQGLSSLGFPAYLNHGFGTLPAISINGYASANQNGNNTNIGTNPFSILKEGQIVHHLDGTLSWVHKKHELKFGGEWRLHQINFTQPGWPSGAFNFDVTGSSQVSSDLNSGGDGLASFLMGVGPPSNGGGGCTPCQVGFVNFVSTESFQYAAFVQDNYRVTPKLTFNLGLRYELNTPRTERYNRMNSLDPTAVSPLQLTAAQISQAQSLGLPSQAIQTLSDLHGIEVFASPANRFNYDTYYKEIQPRFGFAYQTWGGFVLRGGYGIYFSSPRNSASGTGPWGFQGFDVQPPWLTTLNVDHATPWNTLSNTSCQFSAPFTCGVAPPPGNSLGAFNDIGFAAVGPIKSISLNTPYEQAWSFGFQKKLPGKILLDTSYVGKKGTHLYLGGFRENNILPASVLALSPSQIGNLTNPVANPFFDPNPGPCDRTHFICDPNSALSQPTVALSQLLLPYPQYAGFQGDSPPIANSIYHALQIRAEREFSNGLQFLLTYTWSKSVDDASASDDSFVFLGGGTTGGSTLSVQNPYDLHAERAVSVYDIPHIFQASFVYELPIGRGRKFGDQLHPVLDAVVGGWQINGIVRINSGRPLIPLLLNTNAIPTFGQRPILTGTLRRASGAPENFTDPGTSYFSNASFDTTSSDNVGVLQDTAVVAPFTFGNAPRTITSVRQPGAENADVSLFKNFTLSKRNEGIHLQFRAEAFNVFNHPQFQGPDMLVGDSNFGVISSTVNNPRELQLALKLYF